MAKPDHRWTGSSGHLHMSVWDAGQGRAADARDRSREGRAVRPVEGRPAVHGRDDGAVPRARRVHRAVHQLVQALRVAVVGAGQRRLGPRQPDDRLPARRPRAVAPRREPVPRRRHERLPDLRRDDRRRAVRHRARAQARDRVQGQRLHRDRASRACRGRCTRRSASSSDPRRRVEIFGEDVVDHYLNAARVEQETYDSVVHPWDRERYLERG